MLQLLVARKSVIFVLSLLRGLLIILSYKVLCKTGYTTGKWYFSLEESRELSTNCIFCKKIIRTPQTVPPQIYEHSDIK